MLAVALGCIGKFFHDLRKSHFERWTFQWLDDYLIQDGAADLVALNPGPGTMPSKLGQAPATGTNAGLCQAVHHSRHRAVREWHSADRGGVQEWRPDLRQLYAEAFEQLQRYMNQRKATKLCRVRIAYLPGPAGVSKALNRHAMRTLQWISP